MRHARNDMPLGAVPPAQFSKRRKAALLKSMKKIQALQKDPKFMKFIKEFHKYLEGHIQ